jgi:Type I phosphodiesterase / nucleotide pyrophosphatase
MKLTLPICLTLGICLFANNWVFADEKPHNVILFVADGLRPGLINEKNAPAMAALIKNGVRFENSHSIFPTFTMANAASMSSGHLLGDNGIFSNTIFVNFPVKSAANSVTPFIENDSVLGELDTHFKGDYLDEETILAAARKKGLLTAAIGKLGPTLMFDHTERSGNESIIIDDSTGREGIPLSSEFKSKLNALGLPEITPTRGLNGNAGNSSTPGTTVANIDQQNYFVNIATKAVLPSFKEKGKSFVLVFWSRDPDGSQHNQGDSLNQFVPGINGPTSMAAIKNADNDLAAIQKAIQVLGLESSTDILLVSDHGFSTISKQSKTSPSTQGQYKNVITGQLPPGFLAMDIAHGLAMPLFDPDNQNTALIAGNTLTKGNGLIGTSPTNPEVVVAANGGSDLIYLPTRNISTADKIIHILSSQDYVSGIFVNDRLGTFAGTLPMSSIGLLGDAATPTPDIVVNFASFEQTCSDPTTCGVTVSDTLLQQGQGMHGSFSRADTRNTMGAIGPSFKKHYVDTLPASNADIGVTIATLMDLPVSSKGALKGRFLSEATPGGAIGKSTKEEIRSSKDQEGHSTILIRQRIGEQMYFDVAGYPGRTLGLSAK